MIQAKRKSPKGIFQMLGGASNINEAQADDRKEFAVGVAYHIEFDKEEPDMDYTDGKSVARAMDGLNKLAKELGVKPLEDFMGQPEGPASWFEPSEGIAVLDALIVALQANPKRIKASKEVVDDLQIYKGALIAAQTQKTKWHLVIDF